MATIEELRSEVERLTRELDLQSSEISQSAKYGLGLLEEKLALQSKCEELENLYENTKHELDITLEVSLLRKLESLQLGICLRCVAYEFNNFAKVLTHWNSNYKVNPPWHWRMKSFAKDLDRIVQFDSYTFVVVTKEKKPFQYMNFKLPCRECFSLSMKSWCIAMSPHAQNTICFKYEVQLLPHKTNTNFTVYLTSFVTGRRKIWLEENCVEQTKHIN